MTAERHAELVAATRQASEEECAMHASLAVDTAAELLREAHVWARAAGDDVTREAVATMGRAIARLAALVRERCVGRDDCRGV